MRMRAPSWRLVGSEVMMRSPGLRPAVVSVQPSWVAGPRVMARRVATGARPRRSAVQTCASAPLRLTSVDVGTQRPAVAADDEDDEPAALGDAAAASP